MVWPVGKRFLPREGHPQVPALGLWLRSICLQTRAESTPQEGQKDDSLPRERPAPQCGRCEEMSPVNPRLDARVPAGEGGTGLPSQAPG